MIVSLLNRKVGVGKTPLARRPARQFARQGKRGKLIEAGLQGSALDLSERPARRRFDRLFGVIGLARDALRREAPKLARHADHIGIDGPPRVANLPSSALLAADPALIAAQLSPFDGWASEETLAPIAEALVFCSRSPRVSRSAAASHARSSRTRRGAASPNMVRRAYGTNRPVRDLRRRLARWPVRLRTRRGPRNRCARSRDRRASGMATRDCHGGFLARPSDAENWGNMSDPGSSCGSSCGSTGTFCTARLTGDVTPSLRERINIAAFQRVGTVADWLRHLPACEFSDAVGDRL